MTGERRPGEAAMVLGGAGRMREMRLAGEPGHSASLLESPKDGSEAVERSVRTASYPHSAQGTPCSTRICQVPAGKTTSRAPARHDASAAW